MDLILSEAEFLRYDTGDEFVEGTECQTYLTNIRLLTSSIYALLEKGNRTSVVPRQLFLERLLFTFLQQPHKALVLNFVLTYVEVVRQLLLRSTLLFTALSNYRFK